MPASRTTLWMATALLALGLFTFLPADALVSSFRPGPAMTVAGNTRPASRGPMRVMPGGHQAPLQWRAVAPPVWDELPSDWIAEPQATQTIPVVPLPSPTALAPLQSEQGALQEDTRARSRARVPVARLEPTGNNEAAQAQGVLADANMINVTPEDRDDFVALAGHGPVFSF